MKIVEKLDLYFKGKEVEFSEREYKQFYELLRMKYEDERFDTEIEDDFILGCVYRVKRRNYE